MALNLNFTLLSVQTTMPKHSSILIIEDEIIAQHYLSKVLNSLGYDTIHEASSAKRALEILRNISIDIIFMDINLGGVVDGIDCAHMLNQEHCIPIIYTTAYKDSSTIIKASETNIFGYLIKPFDPSDVEAVLSVALKRIELQQQKKQDMPKQDKRFICFGKGQCFDVQQKTFLVEDIPVNLTNKELEILYLLCLNINRNISYDVLREHVWKGKDISDSTIRDTLSRLKKKTPGLNIENIKNYGYVLTGDAKVSL